MGPYPGQDHSWRLDRIYAVACYDPCCARANGGRRRTLGSRREVDIWNTDVMGPSLSVLMQFQGCKRCSFAGFCFSQIRPNRQNHPAVGETGQDGELHTSTSPISTGRPLFFRCATAIQGLGRILEDQTQVFFQRKVYDPPLARYAAVTIGPDRNCPFVCIQAALPTYSKGAEALKYGAVDGTAG